MVKNNGRDVEFEPEITVFTCNYCGYASADTAGALRLQYPANIKVVRLPCTGKADVGYILRAFDEGADGVYVVGCGLGNCHHVRGNERGRARVERAKKILERAHAKILGVVLNHCEDGMAGYYRTNRKPAKASR